MPDKILLETVIYWQKDGLNDLICFSMSNSYYAITADGIQSKCWWFKIFLPSMGEGEWILIYISSNLSWRWAQTLKALQVTSLVLLFIVFRLLFNISRIKRQKNIYLHKARFKTLLN